MRHAARRLRPHLGRHRLRRDLPVCRPRRLLAKPPTFVAVVSTIQGVGAVAAGLLSSRIIGAIGEVATMVVGFVVLAAGLDVVARPGHCGSCSPAARSSAWPCPLFVGFTTLLQKRTPQEVMGRASMAVEVVMSTPQALSMAIGAAPSGDRQLPGDLPHHGGRRGRERLLHHGNAERPDPRRPTRRHCSSRTRTCSEPSVSAMSVSGGWRWSAMHGPDSAGTRLRAVRRTRV